ncbi:hypothetical protein PanWU01x14_314550 [Parasponia andersonii]|uniref:Uncharacterized protein n=1 Tax=Parasponia andersonii TaxID=3476 RepID=A0A2P5ANP8_PARAD|nr:hypothetical protein PanWU01x14_314550 [Parasponia andersonii]
MDTLESVLPRPWLPTYVVSNERFSIVALVYFVDTSLIMIHLAKIKIKGLDALCIPLIPNSSIGPVWNRTN